MLRINEEPFVAMRVQFVPPSRLRKSTAPELAKTSVALLASTTSPEKLATVNQLSPPFTVLSISPLSPKTRKFSAVTA